MSAPKRRVFILVLGLAVVFALLWPSLRPHPAPRYIVTDLGVLPGDTNSRAYGINAQGQVCGFTQGNGSKQACIFGSGSVTPLGKVPPGAESIARDISSTGDVTGTFGPNLTRQAFEWSHGKMYLLGTLPGYGTSEGAAINAQGDVVGTAQNLSKARFWEAFLYSHGKITDIGVSVPGTGTEAQSINAAGQITGETFPLVGRVKIALFLYNNHAKTMTLLPLPLPCFLGSASHVNDAGQVAGDISSGGVRQRYAALWSGGRLTNLGVPAGLDDSAAEGLNNKGVVVGRCFLEDTAVHTFLQQHAGSDNSLKRYLDRETQRAFVAENGKIQVLDDLIPADADWTLIEARAVNDRGQIVGYGLHHGQERAFLLTPTR